MRPTGTRLGLDAQRHRLEGADFDRIDALQRVRRRSRGLDLLTVALGGLAAQPAVGSVIAGVSRPEQVARNVAAAAWQPTAEDLAELAGINRTALPGMTYRCRSRRGRAVRGTDPVSASSTRSEATACTSRSRIST